LIHNAAIVLEQQRQAGAGREGGAGRYQQAGVLSGQHDFAGKPHGAEVLLL